MTSNIFNVILPGIAFIAAMVSLVISLKKQEKIMVLKDVAIICLSLTLILTQIKYFYG